MFETALLPQLAARPGPWSLGRVFSGSALIGGADGDPIAACLLVGLKTSAKLTLTVGADLARAGLPYGRFQADMTVCSCS